MQDFGPNLAKIAHFGGNSFQEIMTNTTLVYLRPLNLIHEGSYFFLFGVEMTYYGILGAFPKNLNPSGFSKYYDLTVSKISKKFLEQFLRKVANRTDIQTKIHKCIFTYIRADTTISQK